MTNNTMNNDRFKFRVWYEGEYKFNVAVGYHPENGKGAVSDAYLMDDEDGAFAILDHEEFIIEQYTGLKDKNGVDIYEGDVLETSLGTYAVSVDDRHGFRFMLSLDQLCKADAVYGEVVGTIHENSNLLKGDV